MPLHLQLGMWAYLVGRHGYAGTSGTGHVGISPASSWKTWGGQQCPTHPKQARHAYFHAPSLITANLQQTFAYLAEDKFAHCCLNTSISRLRFISQCTQLQMCAPLLNYHQDHQHRHCNFHAGQLPMHCNAWICSGVCNAAHLTQAARDHYFIPNCIDAVLTEDSVYCSIKYKCTQMKSSTGELVKQYFFHTEPKCALVYPQHRYLQNCT